MRQETINTIILLSPIAIGGIIAALNADNVNNITENAEAWTRKTQIKVSSKNGLFSNYIANPILWIIVKFSDWTDSFEHQGIKNGARIAATLYLIAAWLYILFFAFMLLVVLAIGALVLYIVFKVLANSDSDVKQGYEKGSRIIGAVGGGKRLNPETGVVQENGMFGWNDTNQRINPETGNIQTNGFLGWNDSDIRIDQESGNIQKDGFFGYNDTDTRVNTETGIIQKNGMLGWVDTDERIDPKTGNHQKKGMFGWSDS